jgi:hypothetical protein
MSNREDNLYIDDEYYDMNSQGRQSTQPDTETGSEMEEDTVEQNTVLERSRWLFTQPEDEDRYRQYLEQVRADASFARRTDLPEIGEDEQTQPLFEPQPQQAQPQPQPRVQQPGTHFRAARNMAEKYLDQIHNVEFTEFEKEARLRELINPPRSSILVDEQRLNAPVFRQPGIPPPLRDQPPSRLEQPQQPTVKPPSFDDTIFPPNQPVPQVQTGTVPKQPQAAKVPTIDELADMFAQAKAHQEGTVNRSTEAALNLSKKLLSFIEDPIKAQAELLKANEPVIPPVGTWAKNPQPQDEAQIQWGQRMNLSNVGTGAIPKKKRIPTPGERSFEFGRPRATSTPPPEKRGYNDPNIKAPPKAEEPKEPNWRWWQPKKNFAQGKAPEDPQDERRHEERGAAGGADHQDQQQRKEESRYRYRYEREEDRERQYQDWKRSQKKPPEEPKEEYIWSSQFKKADHDYTEWMYKKLAEDVEKEEREKAEKARAEAEARAQAQAQAQKAKEQADKARFERDKWERRDPPKHFDTSTTSHEPPSLQRTLSFREPRRLDEVEGKPKPKEIWQRMEMGTPQQDQLKNKEKLVKTQGTAVNQQEIMLDLFQKIQPNVSQSDEVQELIKMAKDSLKMQRQQIEAQQAELEQSKQMATHYSPQLQMPDLYEYVDQSIQGTKQALQAKNLRAAIETFNPDKDTTADFTDTWRQILLYTQQYKLDEDAFINILTILIQGSASRVLYEMTQGKKNLQTILQTLGDLYSKRRTIVDDMNDLNNFKRKPNEAIHTAMQRAKVMAERVRHLWPTTIWETNKKMEVMLSILRQIITEDTKKHLEYEETKYWKTGTILEYNAMLDLVETYESANDQVPRGEKKLVINVCTGTPRNDVKLNSPGKNKGNKKGKGGKKVGANSAEPMDVDGNQKKKGFSPDPVHNTNKRRKLDDEQEGKPQHQQKGYDDKRRFRKGKRKFDKNRPPKKVYEGGNKPPDKQPEQQQQHQKKEERSYKNEQKKDYSSEKQKGNNEGGRRDYQTDRNRQYSNDRRDYSKDRNYSRDRYRSPSRERYRSGSRGRSGYNNYRRAYSPYRRAYSPAYRRDYRSKSPGRQNYYTDGYNRYPRRESRDRYAEKRGLDYKGGELFAKCPDCQSKHRVNSFCPQTGALVKPSSSPLN